MSGSIGSTNIDVYDVVIIAFVKHCRGNPIIAPTIRTRYKPIVGQNKLSPLTRVQVIEALLAACPGAASIYTAIRQIFSPILAIGWNDPNIVETNLLIVVVMYAKFYASAVSGVSRR